jgi:hypothetical protein
MSQRLLYSVHTAALDERLVRLACAQYPVRTLAEARDQCRSFTLEELLDVWFVGWRDVNPAPHMGSMSRILWCLAYAVFTGGAAGPTLVRHPQGTHPKSVLVADVYEAPAGGPTPAFLYVAVAGGARVMVQFPWVPDVLTGQPRAETWDTAEQAVRDLIDECVTRVNLVLPAARLMADVG